jgi:hypothetical protein
MFAFCANPDCAAAFNYHEGRFFRFHKSYPAGENPPNTHAVQHFWLCANCAGPYTLEYSETRGVFLRTLQQTDSVINESRTIAAA